MKRVPLFHSFSTGFVKCVRRWRFVAIAIAAACRDSTGPAVKPAGIRLVSGDNQSVTVGTALTAPPQFVVYDAGGAAISDANVSIVVASGGGKLTDAPTRTSSPATSVGEWTLGPRAGANTITVSVAGVAPLTISATGIAGAAARFVPLTPTTVTGRAAQVVTSAVSARVTDAFDNPLAGAAIDLTASGGSAPSSAAADSTGVVTITAWTLGTVAGQNALTLRSGSATLTFIAVVQPGDPVLLAPVDTTTPTALAGALLAPVRLRLTDKFGNAVGAQEISLAVTSGGGSLASSTVASDVSGIVALSGWTLGRSALPQVVHATTPTLSADIAAAVQSDFQIEVRFFGPDMTDAQKALFTNAAARIKAIIVGAVPPATYNNVSLSAACGINDLPSLDETVHGLIVYASVQPIDGPAGILAESGPCLLRSGILFPSVAAMLFDTDDLATMQSEGILQDVITHEMLHGVGFGTVWSLKGLVLAGGTVNSAFAGAQARTACVGDGGAPVCANTVPLENDMIPGTADSHWRESVFGSELMTGFVNFGGMPLSAITIGSLADIGYVVNPLAADPYVVPAQSQQNLVPVPAAAWERRIQPRLSPP